MRQAGEDDDDYEEIGSPGILLGSVTVLPGAPLILPKIKYPLGFQPPHRAVFAVTKPKVQKRRKSAPARRTTRRRGK